MSHTSFRRWLWLLMPALFLASADASAHPPEGEPFFFIPPGFTNEGRVAWTGGSNVGRIKISVRDAATGELTPCRVSVVGPDGNFYQPATNHLTRYALTGQWPTNSAWGNRHGKAPYRYLGRFFYTTGAVEVAVPPGKSRIEVAKGFEFSPRTTFVKVPAGGTKNVELKISNPIRLSQLGYYGGDNHLHMPRRNEQDENTMFDLMSAEDIQFAAFLAYNEPAGPYAGFMDRQDSPQLRGMGLASVRERDRYAIISGQEYRNATYGHLLLYLRDGLVFPGKSFNADNWPVFGEVERETRDLGGLAIMAHGGYAQEIYADVALGALNAVELLQFSIYRGIGLADWYHILNSGYRLSITGASDWPACRFLGDSRTFVHAAGKPSMADWLRGGAEGRSFVSSGPMLLLEVDGQRPGAQLKKSGPGPHSVTARVRLRCEVTPVQHVELIVNGEVVHKESLPPRKRRGAWAELKRKIELRESSWIAARAYSTTLGGQPDAEAHSNPIYIYLDGRAPYRGSSLDAWLTKIDGQIAAHTKRDFPEKARVLEYFQQARDALVKIRERGGLRADEPVAQTSKPAVAARASRPFDPDQKRTGGTPVPLTPMADEELKTYLQPIPPKSPSEALKMFETVPGFHLELVAAEPLVNSPVAAAFDEDGKLYVCEMRDYPYKPAAGREPIGSVRLLRDTNGDGVFDTTTVFADKLLWAAGVAPWKGGVFVAAPPDIWYFKDTNGDDVADVREKVFTGFGTENQQAMLNNLTWWLDHKIYGSTAGNGGAVRPANDPQAKPIDVKGRDFRFDPVTGEFETITGTVQFGTTFDDWGNRFLCSQDQPVLHVVLPQHYLARNPHLLAPTGIKDLAPPPTPIFRISPIERWREIRSQRRVATGKLDAAGSGVSHNVADATCGVTIYRGGAYPAQYYGTVFTPDPQNNLIHHRSLTPDGVTFKSQRVEQQTEFVRSSDLWFRPVNMLNAPDGTLYCLDMSREILESIHVPLDVAKHLDFTSGRNSGRIYRIAPDGFRSPPPPRLSRAKGKELVAALESPHGWWRDTASRLIYERQDKSLVRPLERLVSHASRPATRVAALWALHGLNALSDKSLMTALNNPHPGVRENAVRLAEPHLNSSPKLRGQVLNMAGDTNTRVRFQVAFTLGEARDPVSGTGVPPVRFSQATNGRDARAITQVAKALADIAGRDSDDQWMRAAILSSIGAAPGEMLSLLFSGATANRAARNALCEPLAEMVGQRNQRQEMASALETIALSDQSGRLLPALGRGLKRAGARLVASENSSTAVLQLLETSRRSARETALDSKFPESRRETAIQLLGCFPFDQVRDALVQLLEATQQAPVQTAAVKALSDHPDAAVADVLLQRWAQFTPDVRGEALQAFLNRESRTLALLRAAERGEVSLTGTDATRRELLLRHHNADISALARKVFGETTRASRAAVVDDYRAALRLDGDVGRGSTVFEKNCATCHALNGKGTAVGPDLASSSSRDPEALLVNILDPSRDVLPNFIQYTVEDKQGRIFSGLIAAQTATSITLKAAQGLTETILRADITDMRSSQLSLMPEGLETGIGHQAMADLLAFLQGSVPATAKAAESIRERDFGTLPGLIEAGDKK